MQSFKISAIALALSAVAMSASALTSIDDASLSEVTGQDGVTIGGDLHIKIGSFTWTDTDATGGKVSFNNITINGLFVQTIDVLNTAAFGNAVAGAFMGYGLTAAEAMSGLGLMVSSGIYDGASDVVQFAFPNAGIDTRVSPTIYIGSITNGNSTKSYGSLEIKNLDLQGTKIWLVAH